MRSGLFIRISSLLLVTTSCPAVAADHVCQLINFEYKEVNNGQDTLCNRRPA